jgi:hypothetical protein
VKKPSDILYEVEKAEEQVSYAFFSVVFGAFFLIGVYELAYKKGFDEQIYAFVFAALLCTCAFFGFRAFVRLSDALKRIKYEIEYGTYGHLLKREEIEKRLEAEENQ